MSEETKQPVPEQEETAGQETPKTEPAAEQETAGKSEKPEKEGKGKKKKDKEKEKVYTLTREQMEAAELAARQLASVTDQFTRLTAEYDNYRKGKGKHLSGRQDGYHQGVSGSLR